MASICPRCDAELAADAINITEGVALCPACNTLSRLSDVIDRSEAATPAIAAAEPPHGCSIVSDGLTTRAVATTRSFAAAAGLAFFALFWNSIVSVFLVVVISGYWERLIGPLPVWMPGLGATHGPERDSRSMPLGVLIFMTIFLTPFVAVGASMLAAVFMSIAGRCEVRLEAGSASVFTGVGPFGWTRRFDPGKVRAVRSAPSTIRTKGRSQEDLVIEADRTIRFGSSLSDERRGWLVTELRRRLLRGPGGVSRH